MKSTIKIHDRNSRGKSNFGWLDSKHTFSFGNFMDPNRMGFRSLRVINEDRVTPGNGFGTHGHQNMEIISIVLDGALDHKDNMGTGSTIRPGEIQKMSAGTGVTHSEFNHSDKMPVHFYQIWIMPDTQNIEPRYEQISLNGERFKNDFVPVSDREGTEKTISIQQDAKIFLSMPDEGKKLSYHFAPGRYGFLQVAKGQIRLNGETMRQSDGAEISNVDVIDIATEADSELILFDLG